MEIRKPRPRHSEREFLKEGGSIVLGACIALATLAVCGAISPARAQMDITPTAAPNHPAVTVAGKSYTPLGILQRNMGSAADQLEPFPPHRIVGNIYYVGSKSLSSFLIVTPQGNILINTIYEKNVPAIAKSVAQLGFKFSDIKIILGNHAHGDHMEGDALAKQMTGARVIVMAEDVPALSAMKPGGKRHPIDEVITDGDTVSLGGVTLTAHLTAGHTPGCTTWTTTATENGKRYDVVFGCSLRSPGVITPEIEASLNRSFKIVRALPCDVPLGDHPAEYRMLEKYARLQPGGPNPFIDKAGCTTEADIQEAMFHAILNEQAAKH
jgi:metallo-beta-lactamase class B